MESQITTSRFTSITAPAVTIRKCPVCEHEVAPDTIGFLECACGWGGPGDPLESARGLSRVFMRLDRRLANASARRDLRVIAKRKGPPAGDGILYTLILLLASTLIHLMMYGALIGLIAFSIQLAAQHAWPGAVLVALFALLFLAAVMHWRGRTKGIQFSLSQLPLLDAALREVKERVGGPLPHRVMLVPGTRWAVFERHPLRRFFLSERVLIVGVGALPLMTIDEAKAILAHELAHYKHAHTLLHRYIASAEAQARYIIDLMLETSSAQYRRMRTRRTGRGSYGASLVDISAFLVWIIALPLALMWQVFHLLRLADSRHAEFQADTAAIRAYGADAFIGGLSAVIAAQRMINGGSVKQTTAMERGEDSLYAAMRRHVAALPADIISSIRFTALYDYRTLQNSHPTAPDRVRAAMLVGSNMPLSGGASSPAVELIVPQGQVNAGEIEQKLTRMLFA